jgi:hypothetical protein
MPAIEFRYFTLRERHYPFIPIKLYYGDRNVKTYGLLDSGSTLSVFRNEIAEDLGIEILSGDENMLQSASGLIKVFIHPLTVQINEERFNMSIGFSSELSASFNILGREGFFERFRITFDELQKKIVLES